MHAITGLPPTEYGELVLKLYEAVQTGLPMCKLAVTFGALRLSAAERHHLTTQCTPWALCHARAPFYMNLYFEKELETPVQDLQRRLGINKPPLLRL